MKYIVFEQSGLETALLFDPLIEHDQFKELNPISAGFFITHEQNVADQYSWDGPSFIPKISVYGKSTSLELESRPEDAIIIERCLSHKGI